MTSAIIDGLKWLGLDWDDEIWTQSSQIERHKAEAMRLLAEGKAYYCYLTQEELDAKRASAEIAGEPYWYGRAGLTELTEEEREYREMKGYPKTLRFMVPDGETAFHDIVHGEVRFNNKEIDDFVILRSDGTPVYMMSVVCDDHDMGVTHILRGDDHLSNTPKQILLYQALGYGIPEFGHVPLILGQDKKRLSKRHGATAVGEYQAQGYLPEAVLNYLALLGWSPGDDREIMAAPELIEAFDSSRLLKSNAVFDEQKLLWMNGVYIRSLSENELLQRVKAFIREEYANTDDSYLLGVLALMKERMTKLGDVFEASYFFEDPSAYDEKGVAKHWKPEAVRHLPEFVRKFEEANFTAADLEAVIRGKAEETGTGAGKLIHPLRIALTGQTFSPGLFEMMELLGKETCLRRLRAAIEALGTPDGV